MNKLTCWPGRRAKWCAEKQTTPPELLQIPNITSERSQNHLTGMMYLAPANLSLDLFLIINRSVRLSTAEWGPDN